MVKFLLVLYFSYDRIGERLTKKESQNLADGYIQGIVEMPAIPRVGEEIYVGETYSVDSVIHNLKEQIVEVHCDVNLFEAAQTLIWREDGWDMQYLRPEGQKMLLGEVKRIKKASKS